MPRRTLIDFYADLSSTAGEFVVYDDGYRSWSYIYADVASAARAFASRLRGAGIGKGRRDRDLGRESRRVDHRAVGVPARGRSAGADRLSRLGRFSVARVGDRRRRAPYSSATQSIATRSERHDRSGMCRRSRGPSAYRRKLHRSPPNIERRTTRRRSSLRQGQRRSRRASSSLTRTSSPTSCRSSERWRSTRNTPGRFCRFVSSICCRSATCSARRWRRSFRRCCLASSSSHGATHPKTSCRQIRTRRDFRSGLGAENPRGAERVRRSGLRRKRPSRPAARCTGSRRWWKYRRIHRLFGFKFWAMVVGAAPLDPELEAFWGRLGFRRRAGIRADRDRADRYAEPPVPRLARRRRQADRRRRGPDRGGRRDPRARGQRHQRLLQRAGRDARRRSRTDGFTPATSGSSMRAASCTFAAARRK